LRWRAAAAAVHGRARARHRGGPAPGPASRPGAGPRAAARPGCARSRPCTAAAGARRLPRPARGREGPARQRGPGGGVRARPRSWILDDAALRALVLRPPRSHAELTGITGLTAGFVERSGNAILRLIEEAAVPAQLPQLAARARPDPQLQARTRHLAGIVQKR